jgi:hypothetical protein
MYCCTTEPIFRSSPQGMEREAAEVESGQGFRQIQDFLYWTSPP